MAVDCPQVVAMELLPLEDPMDTPVLEESPRELQVDHMAVYLQGVPMVSYLQGVPTVPSLDIMDRGPWKFHLQGEGHYCKGQS